MNSLERAEFLDRNLAVPEDFDVKTTFVIKEIKGGVLVGLGELLPRIPIDEPYLCSVRNLDAAGKLPFGMNMNVLWTLSKRLEYGVVFSADELRRFSESDMQVIDGEFDFYTSWDELVMRGSPRLKLVCFDTSFWEIITESRDLVEKLKAAGFSEATNGKK